MFDLGDLLRLDRVRVLCRGGLGAELRDWFRANMSELELPARVGYIAWRDWSLEHPDEFARACRAVITYTRPRAVMDAAQTLIIDAIASRPGPHEWGDLLPLGLSDAEIVWCSDNLRDVIGAAEVLDILPVGWPGVAITSDPGLSAQEVLRSMTNTEFELLWIHLFPDQVARACSAAFDAR